MACLFGHKWDGCKCLRCGKIRNEQHKWNGCKCERCGTTRDEKHDLDLCLGKCKRCGKIIQAEQHNWDGRKCSRCDKILNVNAVNTQDENGNTVLFANIEKRNVEGVFSLVEYGANVNHKNNIGETPLMRACISGMFNAKSSFLNDITIINFLLDAGVETSIKNNRGKTALDIILDAINGNHTNYENRKILKEILIVDRTKRKDILGKVEESTKKLEESEKKLEAYFAEEKERKQRIDDLLPRCPRCGGKMDSGEGIHRNKGTVESWSRCRKCNYSKLNYSRPIQDGDIT